MQLQDLPYPLRLCVEMMYYAAFSEQTTDKTCGEVREHLLFFFPAEMVEESKSILTGQAP